MHPPFSGNVYNFYKYIIYNPFKSIKPFLCVFWIGKSSKNSQGLSNRCSSNSSNFSLQHFSSCNYMSSSSPWYASSFLKSTKSWYQTTWIHFILTNYLLVMILPLKPNGVFFWFYLFSSCSPPTKKGWPSHSPTFASRETKDNHAFERCEMSEDPCMVYFPYKKIHTKINHSDAIHMDPMGMWWTSLNLPPPKKKVEGSGAGLLG